MTVSLSNELVAFFFHAASTAPAALERARQQIEQHTRYRVADAWLSPARRVGLLNLGLTSPDELSTSDQERQTGCGGSPTPRFNRLRVRPRMALLQTGYTTTPDWYYERSLHERGGRLTSCDSGGLAAFCLARFDASGEERLFLWSTRPQLRVIASAQAAYGTVAGTRPRLVHALTRDFAAPDLDLDYLRSSLNGWSIGDHTPYRGTRLVPVDALLRLDAQGASLQPHPTPAYQRGPRLLSTQRRLYAEALREAVQPLRTLPGFELRLSGGKDSRLVAAALWDQRITPSTVICHAHEQEPELKLANEVAQRLGWTLRRARPTFAYRGGLLPTVRHNLMLSDGFFATEPRHLTFPVDSLVGDIGPGLVLGHIELQKGGWARKLDSRRAFLIEQARLKVTRWRECVSPDVRRTQEELFDDFAAGLAFEEDAEYGYWLNYRFRVCRWLSSHGLAHSRAMLPVYPLIDEKVTRVVSCAPLRYLITERLLASTTWALAPALRGLPTLEPYRFTTGAPRSAAAVLLTDLKHVVAPTWARRRANAAASAPGQAPAQTRAQQPSSAAFLGLQQAAEICAHMRDGKLRDELREWTQPQVWAVIEEPSHARMAETQVAPQLLTEFLWTGYQASVLASDGLDGW